MGETQELSIWEKSTGLYNSGRNPEISSGTLLTGFYQPRRSETHRILQ
jgi:hypothetical protein